MTARGHDTDYLQVFRYHVITRLAGGDEDPLEVYRDESQGGGAKGIAGFTEATLPGYDIESVEHHTGLKNLPEKQPGKVSLDGNISLSRGMVPRATKMHDWIALKYLRGEEYRATLYIYQWSQSEAPSSRPQYGATNEPNLDAARVYKYHQAYPENVGQTDLDGGSSDIQMEEIEIGAESYEIDPHRS